MTSDDTTTPREHDDHDHPILEAFNAEDAIEDPGHPTAEPDTTSDSDAPAP